jgi:DNA-binding CsgD family transcriptional regulator
MAMKKGSNRAAINRRQQKVMRYWLMGLGPEEISATLGVNPSTIWRDVQKIKDHVAKRVEMAELYSIQLAFLELKEQWREGWTLYHRKNPKEGADDRLIRALILDRLHRITVTRSRLAGFFSPKVLERITMLETSQARGMRIERIPYDEQLKRGVEDLRNNEGLARSEGLIP